MNFTTDSVALILGQILPAEFCTLSSNSRFHAQLKGNDLIITKGTRSYQIFLDELMHLAFYIRASNSVDRNELQGVFKVWYYQAPLAVFILNSFEELSEKVLRGHQSLHFKGKVSIDEYQEHEGTRLNVQSDSVGRSFRDHLVEVKDYEIVDTYFATNRTFENKRFTEDDSFSLTYGKASVSIPKIHRSGRIERPLWDCFKIKAIPKRGKHFCLEELELLDENTILNELRSSDNKSTLMIFIHGYNVSFSDAVFSASQLKHDLRFDFPVMLFSWPSRGGFRGPGSYTYDKDNAQYAAPLLSNLLAQVSKLGFDEVVVLAHSMGTYCLAEALKEVNSQSLCLSRAVLAASDIYSKAFQHDYAKYFKEAFKQTTIYASSKDIALALSRWKSSHRRLGDAGEITVVEGVDTIDVSEVDHGYFSLRHSYHAKHNRIIDDLFQFLKLGVPAAQRRLEEKLNKFSLQYWTMMR